MNANKMHLLLCIVSICSLTVAFAHNGHHHVHPFIDKRSASSMLSNDCNTNRRSECCTNEAHEKWCEQDSSKSYCMEVNESGREQQCSPSSCPSGDTCYLSVPCKAHYETSCSSNPCLAFPCHNEGTCRNTGTNTFNCNCVAGYDPNSNCAREINECNSNPCKNGATCHDHFNRYSCSCVPGFTGVNCEINIDECASDPCINGGTCNDHINHFTCDCTDRYNGTVCEKDCRPGPVDLLFVVDTSSSFTDDCERMKSFMSNTVNQLAIGPDDFQIAAITYSFSPTLEWSFSQHSDNETLLPAIDYINCTGGATYTGEALEFAMEVFSNPANGGRSNSAFKQIILITDGMSTDRSNAIQQSWNVIANGIKLYVVGIGHFVDHRELHAMVHDSRYVFSANDKELLFTILRETAHPDCTDCKELSSTDIVLLLDSSSNERIKFSTKAAIETVRYLDVDNTDLRIGIMSYSQTTEIITPIGKYPENELSSSITKVTLRSVHDTFISHAIDSGRTDLHNFGRTNSKKILVLYTNGEANNTVESKSYIDIAHDEGITVLLSGIGENVGYEAIRNVVTDSFYALLPAKSDDHTPLQTIKSESWHTNCKDNIFQIRV